MSGSATVSGVRRSTGSIRIDAPGRGFASYVPTHVVILALACVLWWIARDMVSVNRTLNDAATVVFELDPALTGSYRLVSKDQIPISLEVSGPTREINNLVGDLQSKSFLYRYTITKAEIEQGVRGQRNQVSFQTDAAKLQRGGEGSAPVELTIRPVSGDRGYQIVVEAFDRREATVDLADITGEVQGFKVTRSLQPGLAIEVYGPTSQVDNVADETGRPVVHVVQADVNEILRNRAAVDGLPVAELLAQGTLVVPLQLVPIDFLKYRRKDASGQSIEVTSVTVELKFQREVDDVKKEGEFPVNVIMPDWMWQKGVTLENVHKTRPVDVRILKSQEEHFPDAISVVLDLRSLRPDDARVKVTQNGGRREYLLHVTNLYYALDYDRERLSTLVFDNPKLKPREYLTAEFDVKWVSE